MAFSSQHAGLAAACAAGFAFAANYTNHAPLVPGLMEQFHFSRALAGFLTTGIFLTHAVMQIPGGHLADRYGPRRVLIAALALVCAGNFGVGFSNAYWQLLAWKVFVGFGTGSSFVAGARYITGLYAGPRLHMAQGLYGGSVLLGSGFVIFAVPHLLAAFGWRGAFFATATVATAAWLVWIAAAAPLEAARRPAVSFRGMFSSPQLWLLGLVQMASFGLAIVVGAWISVLLRSAVNASPARAGLIGSGVLLLGIVTRPLGGLLVPRTGVRPLLLASLLLSASGCLWLGLGVRSLVPAGIAITLLGVGCGLPYAALFNRAAAMFPDRAGAAMGLVNMLGIVMILAGAPLVGWLADWSGSFQASFFALGAFTLCALAAAFAIKES